MSVIIDHIIDNLIILNEFDGIIRVENGEAKDHTILIDNFLLTYPDIDINNLPSEWAIVKFKSPYLVDDVFAWSWLVDVDTNPIYKPSKTNNEFIVDYKVKVKNNKQILKTIEENKKKHYLKNWVWREERLGWFPPILPPLGSNWKWCEEKLLWVK